MENSSKEKTEETIVSLNEDSKNHTHDEASFDKLLNDQKTFIKNEEN